MPTILRNFQSQNVRESNAQKEEKKKKTKLIQSCNIPDLAAWPSVCDGGEEKGLLSERFVV